MGTYTQRKFFDHPEIVRGNEDAFHDPAYRVSGIEIGTKIVEADGGWWLYLTQSGPLVGPEMPILPEWELVEQ